jgi:hypothetical protein
MSFVGSYTLRQLSPLFTGEVFLLCFSPLLSDLRISAVVGQDDHIWMRPRLGGGRGRGWLALAFDSPNDVQQDLGMARISLGRLIDHLLNNSQELADFPTPAILGDDDALVQRLVQHSLQVLGSRWGPQGLPDCPFLKRLCGGGLP